MTAAEGGWRAAALCPRAARLKYDSSKDRGKEAVRSSRSHLKKTPSPQKKVFFKIVISFLSKKAPSGEAFSMQYFSIFRAPH